MNKIYCPICNCCLIINEGESNRSICSRIDKHIKSHTMEQIFEYIENKFIEEYLNSNGELNQ